MNNIVDPLALDGWLQFNCEKWNIRPVSLKVSPSGSDLPSVEAKLFLDKRGHIYTPPLIPYVPVVFIPTPTESAHRRCSQWLEVSELLVHEVRRLGLSNYILLSPNISDVRAWQWAGYRVRVRYTFVLDFPLDYRQADQAVRNRYRRALRDEYVCKRTERMGDVVRCLQETAGRHALKCNLSDGDLERARELLGGECFRAYVCYSPDGAPVSTQVVLFAPAGRALDWLAGTARTHLHRGVAQLLTKYMLDDLQACGATGIDFVGANVPGVSAAKAGWGGQLVPFYRVESQGLWQMARTLVEWWRFIRLSKGSRLAVPAATTMGTDTPASPSGESRHREPAARERVDEAIQSVSRGLEG